MTTTSAGEITPTEVADRLAIRELFDAYAHCADRRDAEGQKALFTEDTHFLVYMEGEGSEPTQELNGREALTPVFDDLNRGAQRGLWREQPEGQRRHGGEAELPEHGSQFS
jgi:SnoaL-like domain